MPYRHYWLTFGTLLLVLIVLATCTLGAEAQHIKCDNAGKIPCHWVNAEGERIEGKNMSTHAKAKKARRAARASVSTASLVAPLRAKVAEIVEACGSIVVSAYRHGARIPTGGISNHALHRAADLQGNPRCIYAKLKGWPGGYSTDYKAVRHVHISYNPKREWGRRFAHHRAQRVASAR